MVTVNREFTEGCHTSKFMRSHMADDIATGDVSRGLRLLLIAVEALNWLIDIVLIVLQPTETVY